jgi:hypothetical protein
MNLPIPEALARALAKVPADLIVGAVELLQRVFTSPNPKDTLARALQVTAHEEAADAAVDALFAAKRKIAGTGE